MLLAPIVLLAGLSVGVLYVRLLNGPISLKVIAAPIARSISAELPGIGVAVEDAVVQLTEAGAIEVRLRNVRFSDSERAPIALAPLASVEISLRALLSARLAAQRIVLIEPRVLMFYAPGSGLSLSFQRPSDAAEPEPRAEAARSATAPAAERADAPVGALQQIDIGRVIAEQARRTRRGEDATSHLREIGVKDATVIFDNAGRRSVWRILDGDLDLEHSRRRSVFSGSLSIGSPQGAWQTTFRVEDLEQRRAVRIEATLSGLVPAGLPRAVSSPLLAGLTAPVGGDARVELTATGEVMSGAFDLRIGRGELRLPEAPASAGAFGDVPAITVDGAEIKLRYDRARDAVEIAPSTVAWGGGSTVTLQGGATPVREAGAPEGSWQIELGATGGLLRADDMGVPPAAIEQLSLRARYRPDAGEVDVQGLTLGAGGGRVDLTGVLGTSSDTPSVRIAGRIGAMSLQAAKTIWPRLVAPGGRAWVAGQLNRGTIQGGTFSVALRPRDSIVGGGPVFTAALSIDAADVVLIPARGLPPLEVPRGTVRLADQMFEVVAADGAVVLPSTRRVGLKGARFAIQDTLNDPTSGELTFRTQSPLASVVELFDQGPLKINRPEHMTPEAFDGRAEGQFRLAIPLARGARAEDVRIEGKARILDGRGRQLIGGYDVQGGSIAIEVTEQAIDVRGEMLVGGVPAKLTWQRFAGAAPDRQPPIRLTATIDAADRNQLGLDLNHIVRGEVPVDLTVFPSVQPEPKVHVRANMTGAELIVEHIAWRKPVGRAAIVEFDIAKGQRHKLELQNFKVVGDDVAIDGFMALDQRNRLVEFGFPDFSINVVSRLDVAGTLRSDNVWDVKVRGPTFDGRDFFRSLFSVGQVADEPAGARRDQAGVELKVDIDTVIGYSETALRGLKMQIARRGGRLAILNARGVLEGGRPLEVGLQQGGSEPRRLIAETEDAGAAFKLVGFYPNLQGGRMRLEVNLDGRGPAEKTGVLNVRGFRLLGDPVVSEVLQTSGDAWSGSEPSQRTQRRVTRQALEFDWMRVPFSVGHGQFVMEDSELRGPLLGATIKGKADFRAQTVSLGGTYVPLQGLNSAVGFIPGLGQLLAGPKGEGILGITFAIQGPMAQPQVIVNPLSFMAPGIFREMFQMTNPTPVVTPNAPSSPDGKRPASKAAKGKKGPEAFGGWSSETNAVAKD